MAPLLTILSRWARAPLLLWATAVLAVILHGALVLWHFPPRTVREGNPLISIELSCHLAHASEGYEFLRKQHHLWGYSPRYMAGYPFGLWNSIGKRGYELSSSLFPMWSLEGSYYAWIFLTAFLPPLFIVAACHLVGRRGRTTWLCLLLTLVVYHFGNIIAYLWKSGMIAFVFAGALAVLGVALLHRLWERGSWGNAVAVGVCLGAVAWLHPFALLGVAIAGASGLALYREELRRPAVWLRLMLACAVALAVMVPWLQALLAWRDLRVYMDNPRFPSGVKYLLMDLFSDRRYLFHFDRRALLHAVIVLSVVGVVPAWRCRQRGVVMLALAGAGLFICTYGFAYSRFLEQTQPYRFLTTAELFALPVAAVGARELGLWFGACNRAGRLAAAALGCMLLPVFTGYLFDFVYEFPQQAHGLDPDRQAVVRWLKAHRASPGRVLCEDSCLGNVVPYYTGQEVIGGTMLSEAPLANSWPDFAFRRAVQQGGLARYADLFNVAFAVAESPEWQTALREVPGCREAVRCGTHAIFTMEAERLTFLASASGPANAAVHAAPNRIVVEHAPPGEFVLKYHFLRSLRCSPNATLLPVALLDDPVPFIGVRNPQGLDRIEIVNSYAQ